MQQGLRKKPTYTALSNIAHLLSRGRPTSASAQTGICCPVLKHFFQIHLAGIGTCCIPVQRGTTGPSLTYSSIRPLPHKSNEVRAMSVCGLITHIVQHLLSGRNVAGDDGAEHSQPGLPARICQENLQLEDEALGVVGVAEGVLQRVGALRATEEELGQREDLQGFWILRQYRSHDKGEA